MLGDAVLRALEPTAQGQTFNELRANLHEVVELLLEEGAPRFDAVFIGTQAAQLQ